MRVLHLAPVMGMGHGVAEVIAALTEALGRRGVFSAAGCSRTDGHFGGVPTYQVPPDPTAIAELATRLQCRVVVAHGSPYFEALPALPAWFTTIAYEHGDPTPEMFVDDAAERRAIADRKVHAVYPRMSGVVAISEFIREDIRWPDAVVIRSGVDHIPDLGTKTRVPEQPGGGPLRVGTLMRLGAGEANYKGTNLLGQIRSEVSALHPATQFELMGRGTDEDADRLRAEGFVVHLNASDDERTEFLRGLDVFLSPSLWEGMNLPLVEAQALATPGLAFDIGAHPEFTPLVFDTIGSMARQIAAYGSDDALLAAHGRMGYHYVRDHLSWDSTASQLLTFLQECLHRDAGQGAAPYTPPVQPLARRIRRRLGRYKRAAVVRAHGYRARLRRQS